MRWVVVLCALAGCGRLGFDELGAPDDAPNDGPIQSACAHDEDGDGFDDCADNCPHLPDPAQLDDDGDGVGNVCDPGTAAQRLVVFHSLAGGHPFKPLPGGWSQGTDVLDYDDAAGDGGLFLALPVSNVDVWIGVDITQLIGAPKQVAIALSGGTGDPFFYGEVFQAGGATAYVAVSRFDGDTLYAPLMTASSPSFSVGPADLRIGVRLSGMMLTELSPANVNTFTSVAGYAGAPGVLVFLQGVVAQLRYVAVIETPQ